MCIVRGCPRWIGDARTIRRFWLRARGRTECALPRRRRGASTGGQSRTRLRECHLAPASSPEGIPKAVTSARPLAQPFDLRPFAPSRRAEWSVLTSTTPPIARAARARRYRHPAVGPFGVDGSPPRRSSATDGPLRIDHGCVQLLEYRTVPRSTRKQVAMVDPMRRVLSGAALAPHGAQNPGSGCDGRQRRATRRSMTVAPAVQ